MSTEKERLKLLPGTWYGWQMIPGYGDGYAPYCSPILVQHVNPRRTGSSVLELAFHNALYAEGVQDFTLELRILRRTPTYLVAELLYEPPDDLGRTAIISRISREWLTAFCPTLPVPPSDDESGDDTDLQLVLGQLVLRDRYGY